jgi:tRNA(Ile)-lysidine synthase
MSLMRALSQQTAAYIRARSLIRAGERVAVAVSGGADSVGLLRILLELRAELGIVIPVAHFHHGIRGQDADDDEAFVAKLAETHDLEFHIGRGDARRESDTKKISLEAAARNLRRVFFSELLERGVADIVATAHTLDDQAETVLMKLLRGAGTKGLAGIFPEQRLSTGRIVRPLLETRREHIRAYLQELNQPWREDLSNDDLSITRNRLRAQVMPLLREEVNPSTDFALAHAAEIARAEEEYWDEQLSRLLPLVVLPGEPARGGGRKQTSAEAISLDIQKFQAHPLAVRRRLLRAAGEQLGCGLDFEHVQAVLDLLSSRSTRGSRNRTIEIADGWRARLLFRELRLERLPDEKPVDYEHSLPIPGEVRLSELGIVIRACIREDNGSGGNAAYNRAHSISLCDLSKPWVIRNWRAGDRFQPLRHSSEKRLKELLYPLHLTAEQKRLWPVIVMSGKIVWVRAVDSPELRTQTGQQICIFEESAS